MPPQVAALACVACIIYLFWEDATDSSEPTVSWAPAIWLFIASSRYVSHWIGAAGYQTVRAYDEGSPVDRAVFSALIAWGCWALARKRLHWQTLAIENKLLIAYFVYTLLSMLWSDYPLVLLKRWLKELGNPIMALLMLTVEPWGGVSRTIRRVSLAALPLSVLFIRYFPELGRAYTPSGVPMVTGVGDQKNSLGLLCLIAGTCLLWRLLHDPKRLGRSPRAVAADATLAATVLWLLLQSDSQTSTVCLLLVAVILLIGRISGIRQRIAGLPAGIALAGLLVLGLDQVFGFREGATALLGRDATLTNRTSVWEAALDQQGNYAVGAGFMSFWSPERTARIRDDLGVSSINQAHNGYLEQYLNLGYVGVAFVLLLIAQAGARVSRQLRSDTPTAIYRLCCIVSATLYNITEASFYGMNAMWILFLTASLNVDPSTSQTTPARPRRRFPARNGARRSISKNWSRSSAVEGRPASHVRAQCGDSQARSEPRSSTQKDQKRQR